MLTVHPTHVGSINSFSKNSRMGCFCFGSRSRDDADIQHAAEPIKEPEPEVPEEPEEQVIYGGIQERAFWNCPGARHATGDFSLAVAQANTMIEDFAFVESGKDGTYVGVFDGHGGAQAAQYLNDNLSSIVKKESDKAGGPSEEVFRKAFDEAEAQFLEVVRENWRIKPIFAAAGSCALFGLVRSSTLYVASLGDSRAVLGTSLTDDDNAPLVAELMSIEHNASCEKVRQQLKDRVGGDDKIVVEKGGVWRVKGIIQVTRSIGDFYLKQQEFQSDPLYTRFRLPEPLTAPALICLPSVITRHLTKRDRFVIFASDGLWENVESEEAVEVVRKFPRLGIARRLAKLAIIRAAKKRKMAYPDIMKMMPGRRRQVHDDVSVVVLFLDTAADKGKRRPIADFVVKSFEKLPARPDDGSVPVEEDAPDDFEIREEEPKGAAEGDENGKPAEAE